MKNILDHVEKEDIIIFTYILSTYSTFIGVAGAIIYYLSEIKQLTISQGHFIIIVYIVVALTILWISNAVILKIKERKDNENKE